MRGTALRNEGTCHRLISHRLCFWLLVTDPSPLRPLLFRFPHHFRILFWTPAETTLRITLNELDKENSAGFALGYLASVSAPCI